MSETILEKFLNTVKIMVNSPSLPYSKRSEIEKYCSLLGGEFLCGENDPKNVKETLHNILESKPCAFVFGAGVSMDEPFSLPTWSELLRRAVVADFLKEKNCALNGELLNLVNNNLLSSFDLYELAQFLHDGLRRNEKSSAAVFGETDSEYKIDLQMYELVKFAITYGLQEKGWGYADRRFGNYDLPVEKDKDTQREKIKKSLIYKLCQFIQEHNNVKRVITYNYDNVFEYANSTLLSNINTNAININGKQVSVFYDNKGVKFPNYYIRDKRFRQLNSIYTDLQCQHVSEHRLPVYHVHGYIPIFNDADCKKFQLGDTNTALKYLNNPGKYRDSHRLILSEESYDDIASVTYRWRNTIQIDTFLRYNCIFFGFSATDKNFKRFVKLMDRNTSRFGYEENNDNINESVKHYIFFTVDNYIKNIFGKDSIAVDLAKIRGMVEEGSLSEKLRLLFYVLRQKRHYLKRMHIYPIWTTIDGLYDYFERIAENTKK